MLGIYLFGGLFAFALGFGTAIAIGYMYGKRKEDDHA